MMRWLLIATVLFLDSSHLPAPIALAWAHPEFRQRVALEHKTKYIVVPLAVFALAILTVPITLMFWSEFHPIIGARVKAVGELGSMINPFTTILTLFVVWNLYHFGSQNFGLWRLWWRGKGNRFVQKYGWIGGTAAGMVGTPFVVPVLAPVSMWAFGLWHWLPAIWLAAKASRHPRLFWVGSLFAGAIITVSLYAGIAFGSLVVQMLAVAVRLGLGFVHFLYDRWVWRFNDPQVRATIGKELFA